MTSMIRILLTILQAALLSIGIAAPSRAATAIPTGGTYETTVKVPIIGNQVFRLSILDENTAHLSIRGVLAIDDTVEYRQDLKGDIVFQLSSKTERILRQFRTKVASVGYDGTTDTPICVVRPPLPFKIELRMNRMTKGISEESEYLF